MEVEIDQAKINEAIKAVSVANDKIPYFLLLLRTNVDKTSLMVQAANQTSAALSAAELFTKTNNTPLTTAIDDYIKSSDLNNLYQLSSRLYLTRALSSDQQD